MKAIISDRIYIELKLKELAKIDKELTYTIPSYKFGDPPIVIKNMAKIRGTLVAFPVGRLDLIPEDYEIIDKRILKPVDFPEFKLTLRPSQQQVFDEVNDTL